MPKDNNWSISIIAPFQGFSPSYWEETYPSYGNKSMAGAMTDVNIISPDRLTQGSGLVALTNGTQAGSVTTLIDHILNIPSANDVTWGIGGNLLYKISSTAVANSGGYPHTIDKATVTGEDGESVVYYNGYVYYFYNHSGSAGDFGRLTVSTDTFDDDFGSTVPTGAAALTNNPHPAIIGGDGIIYFGNGAAVGYYDPATGVNGTVSTLQLDLSNDVIVVDLIWDKDALWIATNSPNISTGNTNRGIIYLWDTVSTSYQEPIIEVNGKLGAMFVKNGRIFVSYQDLSSTGGFKLGYIVGDTIQELAGFTGTLPQFGQITYFKNMIAFLSNAQVYLWGATSNKLPTALSQYMDGGYSTSGALANPFGTLMVASMQSTSFELMKESGYSILSLWKTLMFDVATSIVDKVKVHYYATASGASVALTLRYNRGASTFSLGTINHTNDSAQLKKSFYPKQECEDFRIEFDWSGGSATNALAIKKIDISGHFVS